MTRRGASGVTLLEVLIAVTLLSLLTVGMSMALRLGLFAFAHTNARLMENRRVAGAQRIVEQELKGLMPVVAPCGSGGNGLAPPAVVFQGLPDTLTMVSIFSLQEAWRGRPQILQFFVIPAQDKGGVRLVVNEIPYTGPLFAGALCLGVAPDAISGAPIPQFLRPTATESTFVLADNLAYCRFRYLAPAPNPAEPDQWLSSWNRAGWPAGLRIEMEPVDPNPARLQPVNITVPVFIARDPGVKYDDR
ncbi:MAG TPA: prepilin-type N-terminal cleavage/methylation domain-containing protein [Bryobacteraceae bacterium]|nr:prepilin-type N-terminal cleavage/methylation domain-containing protein [Bryobacteraceae bacterium]